MLIIVLSSILWDREFLTKIGLRIRMHSVLLSIIFSVVIIILSYLVMNHIAAGKGIKIQANHPDSYIHTFFYTLNEEILLGAILLYYCIKKIRAHPLVISAVVALFFSLLHFIFYEWVFSEGGMLQPATLLCLFGIAFVRNNLILYFNHIGYSWALHFGWIAIMLSSSHTDPGSGASLTESARFNLYLGSSEMIAVSGILSLITMVFILRQKSQDTPKF